MSDDVLVVIPEDPDCVPDKTRQQAALTHFRKIAPDADVIEASVSDRIEFIDCGSNFEEVRCPACDFVIEPQQWQSWMDQDFDGKGFAFVPHAMPCCGAFRLLSDLAYQWPQGFARYQVSARNPNIGKLSAEHIRRMEEILGCPVRVIYQHI